MKEALVILAQAPLAGQVNTRLIGTLTAEQAAELYVCFLRDTFAMMEAVQEERENLSLALCYTPAEELEAFEAADIDGCLLLAQRGDSLGERLQNCCADLVELGFGSIILIGADSPTLSDEIMHEAFKRLLAPNQIVIGPTTDGSCYLIGLNSLPPQLCEQVDWPAENLLPPIQACAVQPDMALSFLPKWYTVITPADVQQLQQQIAAGQLAPKYTSRYLKKLSTARQNTIEKT